MTQEEKIIKNKVGLVELARQLSNVSRACKIMEYSRDSSYRFKELYETVPFLPLLGTKRQKTLAPWTAPFKFSAIPGILAKSDKVNSSVQT